MSAPEQQRPMHAPAPSLAMSAQQAASLHASAGGGQADLSDKLVRLKIDEQQKQQQQQAQQQQQDGSSAAAAASASGAAPAAAAAPAKKKEMGAVRYAAERVIGNGSFGVVYQATVIETGETVAIKKVLQVHTQHAHAHREGRRVGTRSRVRISQTNRIESNG